MELEKVKFQISALFNRVSKLHDKEFEILPNVWEKLNDAHSAVMRCVIGFRQYPDFDRMDRDELEIYLKTAELSEAQKDSMRDTNAKNNYYNKVITWKEIQEAHEMFNRFHSYLVKNRIFLSADLKSKFDTIDQLMWEIWVKNKVGEESGAVEMKLEVIKKSDGPIKTLLVEIEDLVRSRLYPGTTM